MIMSKKTILILAILGAAAMGIWYYVQKAERAAAVDTVINRVATRYIGSAS